jgi:MYXO-CTERM domain-containing protein
MGQMAEAFAPIAVTDSACAAPPSMQIVADAVRGTDSLNVAFSTRYTPPAGGDVAPAFRWDFGDGTTATGATATHTFTAGRYQVTLLLATKDGCSATDTITIEVAQGANQPPHCRVMASPVAGPAPLDATFTAVFGDVDGAVSSATWLFSDGVTADATRFGGVSARRIDRPGKLTAVLEVVDDRGVICRASAQAEAANGSDIYGPQIVSVPTLTAVCGTPYVYGADGVARATGSRPITWALGRGTTGKPAGMTIDATGTITWTPEVGMDKERQERVTIVAQNEAGSVDQDFVVKVDCPQAMGKPCGCASGGETLAVLLAAAIIFTRRRKMHRANATGERQE